MSRPYLRFLELEDYLSYLKRHNLQETHLELFCEQSKRNREDICFIAIASACVSNQVAQCTILLGKGTTLSLIEESESKTKQSASKIHNQFNSIKANLELIGWTVYPGSWSFME
jgi:hypothetical protein